MRLHQVVGCYMLPSSPFDYVTKLIRENSDRIAETRRRFGEIRNVGLVHKEAALRFLDCRIHQELERVEQTKTELVAVRQVLRELSQRGVAGESCVCTVIACTVGSAG